MLKVVFDTNVIISALLHKQGLPALLLDLAINRKIHPFYSPALMDEYEGVLSRRRFNLSHENIENALTEIKRAGTEVIPAEAVTHIRNDPADNRILEVSLAAGASYIITGDKKHFSFSKFKNAKVVTPRQFITQEGINIK